MSRAIHGRYLQELQEQAKSTSPPEAARRLDCMLVLGPMSDEDRIRRAVALYALYKAHCVFTHRQGEQHVTEQASGQNARDACLGMRAAALL